jgi:hypothetical protein
MITGQRRDSQPAHQDPGVGLESITVLALGDSTPQDQPGHQRIDSNRRQPDRHGNQQPPALTGVVGHLRHDDRQTGGSHAGQLPCAVGMVSQRHPTVRRHIPPSEHYQTEPGRQCDDAEYA